MHYLFKTLVILTALNLTGCGTSTNTDANAKTMTGSIMLNPTHLTDQSEYMLVHEDSKTVVAYIESTTVPLADYLEQSGTIIGKLKSDSLNTAPSLLVEQFVPTKPLTQEDVLLRTAKNESQKSPYGYSWSKNMQMLILQSDLSNGSASIQVKDGDAIYLIRLVRNDQNWHIADIEQVGYSPKESGTGATQPPTLPIVPN